MIKSWENCDPFMGGCRDIHKPLTGEPSLVPPEYWEEEELKNNMRQQADDDMEYNDWYIEEYY
jgi:hypothetical protein